MHDETIELARRIVASSWPATNDAVGDEAVRAVINWLGSALIGTRASWSEFDDASTGIGIEATALVLGEGFDALNVAAMTAAGAEALCYVDTHVPSMLSPSIAVGAALLPLAEQLITNGAAFVHAYLLGVETACRAAMSVGRDAADSSTSLACNALGAAAACARLAGLDEACASFALSAAWRQATAQGSVEACAASAARIGLRATLDAKAGWLSDGDRETRTSASSSLEFTTDLLEGWGSLWQLTRLAYHAYPCALFVHPVAEASLQLKRTYHLTQRQIAAVEVRMPPQQWLRNRGADPTDAAGARHSIEHVAAVALLDGTVGLAQFEPARLRSARVREVRAKVQTRSDEQLIDTAAHVRITLASGETIERRVRCPLGHPMRPLADHDLSDKFRSQAADVLATDQAERLLGLAWNIRALPDVGGLIRSSIPDDLHEPAELPGSPLIPR
jgi:2-methylcitrate dehydratase PrpD